MHNIWNATVTSSLKRLSVKYCNLWLMAGIQEVNSKNVPWEKCRIGHISTLLLSGYKKKRWKSHFLNTKTQWNCKIATCGNFADIFSCHSQAVFQSVLTYFDPFLSARYARRFLGFVFFFFSVFFLIIFQNFGTHRGYLKDESGMLWGRIGDALGTHWGYPKDASGMPWERIGDTLRTHQGYFGNGLKIP